MMTTLIVISISLYWLGLCMTDYISKELEKDMTEKDIREDRAITVCLQLLWPITVLIALLFIFIAKIKIKSKRK